MISLSAAEIADRVRLLRKGTIVGSCIDMLPYGAEYDAEVVRLRSLSNVRYFMNLIDEPTLAGQAVWREGYARRNDDVMWLIRDKSGRICGTNRLYDISALTGEKGSLIVDPEVARLSRRVRIRSDDYRDCLHHVQHREDHHTRPRGQHSNEINERAVRIRSESVTEIRGVKYERSFLTRETWNPSSFCAILEHWARRYV